MTLKVPTGTVGQVSYNFQLPFIIIICTTKCDTFAILFWFNVYAT